MSRARRRLDWEKQLSLALHPGKAVEYRRKRGSKSNACSMCGEYCALKVFG
jgi:phosphomethylpyrimidine synthase